MYPLFSPQSLIAEGSVRIMALMYVFPVRRKTNLQKNTCFHSAALSILPKPTLILHWGALQVQLNYSRNEVARGILNKTMTNEEALRWLMEYGLMSQAGAAKSISFIQANRSYVICYNYGQDLVGNYIESKGGTLNNPGKRWELFEWLLSNPVVPSNLILHKN